MVKLTQEELLEKSKGAEIKNTILTKGWVDHIKPHLEKLMNNSWVDPREAKNQEDFIWHYNLGFAAAKSVKDILDWLDNMVSSAEMLEKKEKGEIPSSKFEEDWR